MDLRTRYEREAAVLGGQHVHATLVAYARAVLRAPWIFGASKAGEATEAARALLRSQLGPPRSRWVATDKTTPSGKTVLRCQVCSEESPIPHECRHGCVDSWPE